MNPISLKKYLGIFFIFQVSLSLLYYSLEIPIDSEGPPYQIAKAARYYWTTGSFELPDYRAIHEQLLKRSQEKQNSGYQDIYSLTKDGRLILMHAPIVAWSASWFYGIFGEIGLWLFNQCVSLALAFFVYLFIQTYSGKRPNNSVLYMHLLILPHLLLSYTISHDLFAALLILAGVSVAYRLPVLGALILGLSLFVRPSNIALAPLLCLPLMIKHFRWSYFLKLVLGFSLIALAYSYLNYLNWGSPFVTANQRMPSYSLGNITFYNPSISVATLLHDWGGKLFTSKAALLLYAPPIAGIPLALIVLRRHPHFFLHLSLSAIAVLNALIIFSFHCWHCSVPGNRYLLPVCLLLLLTLFEAFMKFSCKEAQHSQ